MLQEELQDLIIKHGRITNAYNLGNITAKGKTSAGYTNVGGISGYNNGYITYVYSMGLVTGASSSGRGIMVGQQLSNSAAYLKYGYGTSAQTWPIIGYRKTGSAVGCEKIAEATLKGWDASTILTKLGENFKKNTNENFSRGLPILSWQ